VDSQPNKPATMEVPQEEVDPQPAMVEAIPVEEVDLQDPQQATVEELVEEVNPQDLQEEVAAAMVVAVTHLVETPQGHLDLKDPNDLNNQWAWIPN
jgi:hypothetical protein